MGYKITLDSNGLPEMSYDEDTTIATDLLLSALVPQGSFFLDPTFGLRAMPKKITEETMGLVEDYFKESAEWLLTAGKAKTLEVTAEPDLTEKNQINIKEEALQANDTIVEFTTFMPLV